jgi:hypothetical protein
MQSDRFAREIVAFLTLSGAARLRRLMRNPLGGLQGQCGLIHEMRLKVVLSDAVVCGRGLVNYIAAAMHAKASACHPIGGNPIGSGPMESRGKLC